MERLLALNLDFARSSFDLGASSVQPAADTDWQAMVSQQRSGLQQATERTAGYVRGVYDISAAAQAEVADLVSSRMGEVGDSMTSMLGTLTQSSPAGSEGAVAMAKSAIANTRSLYDQLIKTTQQMTAANAAVMGKAAQTIGTSVPAAKAAKKAA